MNKDTILSILRTILTLVGTYMVGRHLFGQVVDGAIWEQVAGAILGVGSIAWGIIDKSATVESIQSALRSAVIVVGGLLVSSGKLKDDTLTAIVGLVTTLVPVLLSFMTKKQVKQISTGQLQATDKGRSQPNPS